MGGSARTNHGPKLRWVLAIAIACATSLLVAAPAMAGTLSTQPTGVSFGNVPVGQTGNSSVMVMNSGTTTTIGTVSISGANAAQFSNGTGCNNATLGNGQSCTISLSFTPASPGPKAAVLNIPSDGTGASTVNLNGIGTAPEINVGPTSIMFGNQQIGTGTMPTAISISNTGTAPLATSHALGGTNASEFAITSTTCTGTVQPMASCNVNVRFEPDTVGGKSAVVTINSNDMDEPTTQVSLSGTGVNASLSLAPAPHDFGSVTAGSTSAAQTFTVTSDGDASVNVISVALTGPNADQFQRTGGTCGTPPFMLAASNACTVEVRFAPTSVGAKSGSLLVSSSAPDSPDVSALTGIGTEPPAMNPPPAQPAPAKKKCKKGQKLKKGKCVKKKRKKKG